MSGTIYAYVTNWRDATVSVIDTTANQPVGMCSGTPRRMNKSESTSMTSTDFNFRSTRMAGHECPSHEDTV